MDHYYTVIAAALILSLAVGATFTALLLLAEHWRKKRRMKAKTMGVDSWPTTIPRTYTHTITTMFEDTFEDTVASTTNAPSILPHGISATVLAFPMSGKGTSTGVLVNSQPLLAEMEG